MDPVSQFSIRLATHFSADEVRAAVGRVAEAQDVSADLPGGRASAIDVATAAVTAFHRRSRTVDFVREVAAFRKDGWETVVRQAIHLELVPASIWMALAPVRLEFGDALGAVERAHILPLPPGVDEAHLAAAEPFEAYGRLFDLVGRIERGGVARSTDLLHDLATHVQTSTDRTPLEISGAPGTGKSTLLTMLYLWMRRACATDEHAPLPILLSLHTYEKEVYEDATSEDALQKQTRSLCFQHLAIWRAIHESQPNRPVVLLLDGFSRESRFKETTLATIDGVFNEIPHRRVTTWREEGQATERPFPAQVRVRLNAVDAKNPECAQVVKKALAAGRVPIADVKVQAIVDRISRYNLGRVDLFSVGTIIDELRANDAAADTFSELLLQFCRRYYHGRPDPQERVRAAARMAFEFTIKGRKFPADNLRGNPDWKLVHHHPTLRSFLVAHHVVATFREFASQPPDAEIPEEFEIVYPYQINRFQKDLIHQDADSEARLAQAFSRFFAAHDHQTGRLVHATTHAAYLAGRLGQQQAQSIARRALADLLKKVSPPCEHEEADRLYEGRGLLLARTVYISLAYLGEEGVANQYIRHCLRFPAWERVNRGFHLEYYGDMPYNPTAALTHSDTLGPWDHTFSELSGRLDRLPKRYPLFEIELFTLCSLAQHRHAQGQLEPEKRSSLVERINRVLAMELLLGQELSDYLKFVERHLREEDFRIGNLARDLYRLKTTPRSGWERRHIANPESVAEHSFGAALLAILFLPAARETAGGAYSKDAILKMLLVHDLAEAYTGDLVPGHKGPQERANEREWMRYVGFHGGYAGLESAAEVARIYEEFEACQTLNAQIAKDLDRAENLMQLLVYRSEGREIKDFSEWRGKLVGQCRTEEGRRVMEIIQTAFT